MDIKITAYMKLPKIITDQITLKASERENQLRVEINPKKKAYTINGVDNSGIDIIRLVLTSVEGVEDDIYMTPDEALEIASCLTDAVTTWMVACSKGYREDILNQRVVIAKSRIKAHKAKK